MCSDYSQWHLWNQQYHSLTPPTLNTSALPHLLEKVSPLLHGSTNTLCNFADSKINIRFDCLQTSTATGEHTYLNMNFFVCLSTEDSRKSFTCGSHKLLSASWKNIIWQLIMRNCSSIFLYHPHMWWETYKVILIDATSPVVRHCFPYTEKADCTH